MRHPPSSTLFPYTTLFRSGGDSMSARIVHIASNTFREAVRDRVLYNLIAFALLLSGAAILVDRKSTRLNSSHANISYAVFCLKKKNHHCRMYEDLQLSCV